MRCMRCVHTAHWPPARLRSRLHRASCRSAIEVLVGALERHAVEPPDAQVVAAARDHVVRADQRRERHEARQRVLGPGLRPVAAGACSTPRTAASARGAVASRHAKHRGLPGRGWAHSCARARSGGCGRAGAAWWRRTSVGSAGRPWAVTKRIHSSAGTMATSTPSATHQLTRMPPHRISSMPVPNSTTSGTSGMPSFIAGRVAPL